jgi:hypothetical protein
MKIFVRNSRIESVLGGSNSTTRMDRISSSQAQAKQGNTVREGGPTERAGKRRADVKDGRRFLPLFRLLCQKNAWAHTGGARCGGQGAMG